MQDDKKGYFIILEGIDGAGKSIQSKFLYRELSKRYRNVKLTTEPSNRKIGRFIKKIISRGEKFSAEVETLLFTADRLDQLENEINPLINRGISVIVDRYYYSTLAYQGAQGIDLEWIRSLNQSARRPDLAFYLDIDSQVALRRIKKKKSFFEVQTLLEAVREIYLKLVEEKELIFIDSNRSIEEVHKTILAHTLDNINL